MQQEGFPSETYPLSWFSSRKPVGQSRCMHDQLCHVGINARRKALSSLAVRFGCHANQSPLSRRWTMAPVAATYQVGDRRDFSHCIECEQTAFFGASRQFGTAASFHAAPKPTIVIRVSVCACGAGQWRARRTSIGGFRLTLRCALPTQTIPILKMASNNSLWDGRLLPI